MRIDEGRAIRPKVVPDDGGPAVLANGSYLELSDLPKIEAAVEERQRELVNEREQRIEAVLDRTRRFEAEVRPRTESGLPNDIARAQGELQASEHLRELLEEALPPECITALAAERAAVEERVREGLEAAVVEVAKGRYAAAQHPYYDEGDWEAMTGAERWRWEEEISKTMGQLLASLDSYTEQGGGECERCERCKGSKRVRIAADDLRAEDRFFVDTVIDGEELVEVERTVVERRDGALRLKCPGGWEEEREYDWTPREGEKVRVPCPDCTPKPQSKQGEGEQ